MRIHPVAAAAVAVLLAACSDSTPRKATFSTRGLVAPMTQCLVDPRRVGEAERIQDIDEGNGCAVDNAWRLRSLMGVRFSQPAIVNCGVVAPLSNWMAGTVQPAAQRAFGESVVAIDVAASYSCRARNNKNGAKMSEHGFGNAIDVAAFTLESGRKVEVEQGFWGSRRESRFLADVREGSCRDFSTVLGPGSDRHHKDHIHLDLANRSGRYCR
jgi:hypothetical protein